MFDLSVFFGGLCLLMEALLSAVLLPLVAVLPAMLVLLPGLGAVLPLSHYPPAHKSPPF